jgi:hypothetical protein
VRIVRGVLVLDESVFFAVISIEAAASGANPQVAALVYGQSPDKIVTQAVGIVRVVAVHFYAGCSSYPAPLNGDE